MHTPNSDREQHRKGVSSLEGMIDQAQGRAGSRGCFEQRMDWQFDIKYRADTADQSDGQQRMATEGKEVVVAAYGATGSSSSSAQMAAILRRVSPSRFWKSCSP